MPTGRFDSAGSLPNSLPFETSMPPRPPFTERSRSVQLPHPAATERGPPRSIRVRRRLRPHNHRVGKPGGSDQPMEVLAWLFLRVPTVHEKSWIGAAADGAAQVGG